LDVSLELGGGVPGPRDHEGGEEERGGLYCLWCDVIYNGREEYGGVGDADAAKCLVIHFVTDFLFLLHFGNENGHRKIAFDASVHMETLPRYGMVAR
jgi:hypothetical protein